MLAERIIRRLACQVKVAPGNEFIHKQMLLLHGLDVYLYFDFARTRCIPWGVFFVCARELKQTDYVRRTGMDGEHHAD